MTLCIAAVCDHNERPAIVLLSDWRVEHGDYSGGQIANKLGWIRPMTWAALRAGAMAEADRLTSVYTSHFETLQEPIYAHNVRSVMDEGFRKYRLSLINWHLSGQLGISYESLLKGITFEKDGAAPLPDGFLDPRANS